MDTIPQKHRQFDCVDVMRLVFALFVVALHVPLFPDEFAAGNTWINGVIGDVAVPFFFIVSSFLFFRKLPEKSGNAHALFLFEKRLFILYVVWTLIYLPIIQLNGFAGHFDEVTFRALLGQGVSIAKDFLIGAPYLHLWYVNTLMLSVALLYLLRKLLPAPAILVVCVCLTIVFDLLCDSDAFPTAHAVYFKVIPYLLRNTFRKGMFSCSIGLLFAERMFDPPKNVWIICLAALTAVTCAAVWAQQYCPFSGLRTICLLLNMLQAAAVFSLACRVLLPPSPAYRVCRQYSSVIYFSHMLFFEGLTRLAAWSGSSVLKVSVVQYLLVVLLSTLLGTVIFALEKRRHFQWLHYIY